MPSSPLPSVMIITQDHPLILELIAGTSLLGARLAFAPDLDGAAQPDFVILGADVPQSVRTRLGGVPHVVVARGQGMGDQILGLPWRWPAVVEALDRSTMPSRGALSTFVGIGWNADPTLLALAYARRLATSREVGFGEVGTLAGSARALLRHSGSGSVPNMGRLRLWGWASDDSRTEIIAARSRLAAFLQDGTREAILCVGADRAVTSRIAAWSRQVVLVVAPSRCCVDRARDLMGLVRPPGGQLRIVVLGRGPERALLRDLAPRAAVLSLPLRRRDIQSLDHGALPGDLAGSPWARVAKLLVAGDVEGHRA